MNLYTFQTANNIVTGNHAIDQLFGHLDQFKNIDSVYIITQQFVQRLGYLDAIKSQLDKANIAYACSMDVEKEPTASNIEKLYQSFLEDEHQLIIGIGGGSVLDAAKIVSVMKTNLTPIKEMVGIDQIDHPGIPIILIPTTSGTGSEVTPNAIVTFPEDQLKMGIVSRHLLPDLVIIDPMLTLSVPPDITAATGMDAFTHALESFVSNKANPISDMFALEAIRLIGGYIQTAYERGDDIEARTAMMFGAMYGGMALTSAGTAGVHAMAYPLGGQFNITHGVANSMLLPHVMAFNFDAIVPRLACIGHALQLEPCSDLSLNRRAESVILWIEEMVNILNIPQNLAAFGVTKDDVPELAKAAHQVKRLMDNNPKLMGIKDIEDIYYRLL